jgi:hydroxymethylbilane synthase
LALVQARQVQNRLKVLFPDISIDLVIIKTTGDISIETPLLGKGVFIKEIEEALLSKQIDLAVHSFKDLPTESPAGLTVAAVPEREDPRDCLISRFGEQLRELPRGSVVGTGSLRRKAQILRVKKDIRVATIRGNLDTRLRKVQDGDVTAIVVAYAGVRRLGLVEEVAEVLSFDVMLPAPGQGCLAVQVRSEDTVTRERVEKMNHVPSYRAAQAERSFLAALGGGCLAAIAAHAWEEGGLLWLDGLVLSPTGAEHCREKLWGLPGDATRLGEEVGKKLLSQGAAKLLEAQT